jgi:hypothetical protein
VTNENVISEAGSHADAENEGCHLLRRANVMAEPAGWDSAVGTRMKGEGIAFQSIGNLEYEK